MHALRSTTPAGTLTPSPWSSIWNPGVSRSETLDLMSFRGMPLGELSFDNVKVRPMEGINLARVDAANYACGFLKAAIRECSVGANNRIAFGKPLSDLQTIQIKIGQMATAPPPRLRPPPP